MAERYPGDGAAENGFGRRSLHDWEARLLYEANFPAPANFRGPPYWRLSVGGVYIPPPPVESAELDEEIQVALAVMSDEERALPERFPDNHAMWEAFFRDRYERELVSYEGPPPPPARNNSEGRRHWWSTPGRTLAAVLDHIQEGNSPILQMPPRTPVPAGSTTTIPTPAEATTPATATASKKFPLAPPDVVEPAAGVITALPVPVPETLPSAEGLGFGPNGFGTNGGFGGGGCCGGFGYNGGLGYNNGFFNSAPARRLRLGDGLAPLLVAGVAAMFYV